MTHEPNLCGGFGSARKKWHDFRYHSQPSTIDCVPQRGPPVIPKSHWSIGRYRKIVAPGFDGFYGPVVACSVTILGSGSGGNCAYVETDETRLLIDAGFSARQIRQRMATIGRTPESLTAILVTHEHGDHVQGLPLIAHRLGIPVYANRLTLTEIEFQNKTAFAGHVFETGASFEIGDVLIDTFSIPHDAQDPVGFLVRSAAGNIGFLTDLGHATRLVIERLRCANVLMLEANHDVRLLQEDVRRPWATKQRILGRHGHLSNEAAAETVEQIVSENLRHLYLGHLSKDCNRPDLARDTVANRLERIGALHVNLEVASQEVPSPTLSL